ncbi:unnamed protein product [Bursaphelenchus xylophilus]|uniref:(pine wood nematode) hypothetical protein n=1 Tax=Bursaphelenchus xylophilus TaxID=6326 RepID=A0A811L524_BURXY|nr:unnamed protein product [Bursaphelenchus xylophilus]CAG9109545.1 unnamed protein product [Bursaphelenchus xylophilus]
MVRVYCFCEFKLSRKEICIPSERFITTGKSGIRAGGYPGWRTSRESPLFASIPLSVTQKYLGGKDNSTVSVGRDSPRRFGAVQKSQRLLNARGPLKIIPKNDCQKSKKGELKRAFLSAAERANRAPMGFWLGAVGEGRRRRSREEDWPRQVAFRLFPPENSSCLASFVRRVIHVKQPPLGQQLAGEV